MLMHTRSGNTLGSKLTAEQIFEFLYDGTFYYKSHDLGSGRIKVSKKRQQQGKKLSN